MPVYYQNPNHLQQAILSILEQTYAAFRFIIVIDGAAEMLEWVRLYTTDDTRVEIIENLENLGVAGALNVGFGNLLTDPDIRYLTWVSSDNQYDGQFLETLRRTLRQSPKEVGLAYSSFRSIDDNGTLLKSETELALLRQFQSQPIENILDSSMIGVSFMYRKEYALLAGGYRYAPIEDYDFWLRLTEVCGARYIPVELMNYRVNSAFSVSSTLHSAEKHRNWRLMYHLTRKEARIRRGIPVETTVLFMSRTNDDSEIARVEALYEQLYSNYTLCFADLTSDCSIIPKVSQIPHPSVTYSWFPGSNELEVLYYASQFITTPFTFIYRNGKFENDVELHFLSAELRKLQPGTLSVFQSADRSEILHRFDLLQELPLGNELFKTAKLTEWLICHRQQLFGGMRE
jgi:glycosyltransferase involved in cell wall biosynthesis